VLHAQIRAAVRAQLEDLHGAAPNTVLRDELGLSCGATRVDVAAINGHLTGCEIKGSQDRLDRLPHQVDLYGQVLDFAILVAEPKFVERVADYVPDWWGVAGRGPRWKSTHRGVATAGAQRRHRRDERRAAPMA
jgi:hypothetical protein